VRREWADVRSRKVLSQPRAKPALLSMCGKAGDVHVPAGSRGTEEEGLQRQAKTMVLLVEFWGEGRLLGYDG